MASHGAANGVSAPDFRFCPERGCLASKFPLLTLVRGWQGFVPSLWVLSVFGAPPSLFRGLGSPERWAQVPGNELQEGRAHPALSPCSRCGRPATLPAAPHRPVFREVSVRPQSLQLPSAERSREELGHMARTVLTPRCRRGTPPGLEAGRTSTRQVRVQGWP